MQSGIDDRDADEAKRIAERLVEQRRSPDPEKQPAPVLTQREMDVLRCFAKGRLYKETADDLGISFAAVHKHQHNIFRKLHVGNRTEAVLKWLGDGKLSNQVC